MKEIVMLRIVSAKTATYRRVWLLSKIKVGGDASSHDCGCDGDTNVLDAEQVVRGEGGEPLSGDIGAESDELEDTAPQWCLARLAALCAYLGCLDHFALRRYRGRGYSSITREVCRLPCKLIVPAM